MATAVRPRHNEVRSHTLSSCQGIFTRHLLERHLGTDSMDCCPGGCKSMWESAGFGNMLLGLGPIPDGRLFDSNMPEKEIPASRGGVNLMKSTHNTLPSGLTKTRGHVPIPGNRRLPWTPRNMASGLVIGKRNLPVALRLSPYAGTHVGFLSFP
ncbi:hypothetical protein LY76DRAFT_131307 [Colletotrichum caudatum]|nr:hypothetical protein LY76DRAFT_131307 [Colletotrichum caudatum]